MCHNRPCCGLVSSFADSCPVAVNCAHLGFGRNQGSHDAIVGNWGLGISLPGWYTEHNVTENRP